MTDMNDDSLAAPNPIPKLIDLLAFKCGGTQTSDWINDEIVQFVNDRDPRINPGDLIRTLLPLVIHRHAHLGKRNRSYAVTLVALLLTNPDHVTAVIESVVKSLDTLILKPTAAGKHPGLVPLSSIMYACDFIVQCMVALAHATPQKLAAVLCLYVGLALHHPHSVTLSTKRFIKVTSPTRPLWTMSLGLAPKFAAWTTSAAFGSDPLVVHGSLALLSRVLVYRLVPWNHSWDTFVLSNVALCKLPVPSSVLHVISDLIVHLDTEIVLNATEKGLLRSPEVILPFLATYLPALTGDPIDFPTPIATSISNQLVSSNEANAKCAHTVFTSLWKVSTPPSRAMLTSKALSTTATNGWKLKLNVYNVLRAPVQLTSADIEHMAKLVKGETNDSVAIAVFEILAPYAADGAPILDQAWPRVTEKIRKQVLGAWFDVGALVPAARLVQFTDHVALAHILKAGAFDAKRDAAKVSTVLSVKFVNAIDPYLVYCVSHLVKHNSTLMTPIQLDHILGLILSSPHTKFMSPELCALPATYTALVRVLAATPSPTTPAALVLSNPSTRRQYLSLLHHINSEPALLPLLLFAHHPQIPEDTWATLAFHAKVRVEQWIQVHQDAALQIVRTGLVSSVEWERHASLRAASTLVWIDPALLIPLIHTAVLLVHASEPPQQLDKTNRPRPSGKKAPPPPKPAASAEPLVNRIPLALNLIQSVMAHNVPLDAVVLDLVTLMQSLGTLHTELPKTWQAICRCLDPSISSVHDSIAWLLCTLPPIRPDGSTPVIEMTESIDDRISSVLFQVAMKTQQDPIHPVTMTILHQVLERVLLSAQRRTQTSDKATLNRILDHVAFLGDIYAQNATLAISPVIPVLPMMRNALDLLRTWRKQAQGKAHEALVTLCHANPATTNDQLELLLNECTYHAGMDHVVLACIEGLLYVKPQAQFEGGWPHHMHVLVHALSCHPIYFDLATQVIDRHKLSVKLDDAVNVITFSEKAALASCSASFLSKLLERDNDAARSVAPSLLTFISKRYKHAMEIPVVKDEFGIPVKVEKDTVTPRMGLLECFASLAPYLAGTSAVLKTWVPQLDDVSHEVSHALLAALRVFVRVHPNEEFVAVLQSNANHKSDEVREAVVVLTGECACHFKASDPKLADIVDLLVKALRTPSESVQTAVASCLAKLPVDPNLLTKRLLDTLFKEPKYGIQRGAAYGIASLAAANPHPSLFAELELMTLVRGGLASKEMPPRQAALLLMECCTLSLGRMFESWLIVITPTLLKLFGDTNTAVRQATIDLARIMMKNISTHAVKLLMPTLLGGLHSDAWRVKKASVELLSSMAYCSADKLSTVLPTLMPAMLEAVGDSHIQVSKAARDALNTFSSTITTPEVECMVPMLMDALIHGTSKTLPALQALCVTTFEHYLDPPALSFIIPVIIQALRSRTTDLKFLAAQILGNLTRLTDQRDLTPYINKLMPALLLVVADTVTKTRAMACRALGILIRTMGVQQFPSLVPDLFLVLDSPSASAVEKSGAAQGQAEVIAALGKDHLEKWMPRIMKGLHSKRRDGHLLLLVYLPVTFGAVYTEFIPQTLPAVLAGLADESELVRDSALRAGSVLIDLFTHKAIDLLFPELMRGVFDRSWRIRQSSVQLLGDMLGRIMGQKATTKKAETNLKLGNSLDGDDTNASEKEESDDESEEDEEEPVHQTHNQQVKRVVETLGMDKYHRTLASLYVLRSDSSNPVRQTSANVWRMLVSNTPRQLKEILPVLLSIILEYLAREPSSSAAQEPNGDEAEAGEEEVVEEEEEIVTLCRETLVDIIRKLGDPILVQILPLLNASLETSPLSVCSALKHVMRAAGRQGTSDHKGEVTSIVTWALNQSSETVRKAGADVFDELLHQTGTLCVESVLLPMLDALPDSLNGLQHVMLIRGHIVMPVLLPRFMRKMDAELSNTLASLLGVGTLGHKTTLLVLTELLGQYNALLQPALCALLSHPMDEETVDEVAEILDEFKESCPMGVAISIGAVSRSAVQYQRTVWLGWLMSEMHTEDPAYMEAIYGAMDAVVKSSPKPELESSISTITTGLSKQTAQLAPGHEHVRLFANHPKGCGPIFTVILHILMYGTHKEQALRSLVQLIKLTPAENLRGYVTSMTGALIRLLSEQQTSVVKALILEAVGQVVRRVGDAVRPFVPQLTRTVMKQVLEEGSVGSRAHDALVSVLAIHPRPEAVVVELLGVLKSTEASDGVVAGVVGVLVASVAYVGDLGVYEGISAGVGRHHVDAVEHAVDRKRMERST